MTEIGVIFKRNRIKNGLSQQKLANKAGVDLNTIYRIEKGYHKPFKGTAELICDALGIPFNDISDKIYSKNDYGKYTRR